MPLVNVMVNGKAYTLGCGEGEEPHLKQLAAVVDSKVREALSMVGTQASDTKLLLTAALLLADEHHEALGKQSERDLLSEKVEAAESVVVDVLEAATTRLEDIARRLASA